MLSNNNFYLKRPFPPHKLVMRVRSSLMGTDAEVLDPPFYIDGGDRILQRGSKYYNTCLKYLDPPGPNTSKYLDRGGVQIFRDRPRAQTPPSQGGKRVW